MKKDLLSIFDLTQDDLSEIFNLADQLKHQRMSAKPLEGKSVAMIFQKPSLRTRVSFEVGIYELGGHPVFLAQESIGIGTRESTADVARLLSRYCSAIVARLFGHEILLDLAKYATIPVINALTDHSHPCQVISDVFTLKELGKLKPGVKIAFIGDGNNVVNSWLEIATLIPIHFVLTAPESYEPDRDVLAKAKSVSMSKIEIMRDPLKAAEKADVLYTDVWVSMGQEEEKAKRLQAFKNYTIDAKLLKVAKDDCIVMHCLPAHRGEEISEDIIDGTHSVIFDQAENRLHVQKAIFMKLLEGTSVNRNGIHRQSSLFQEMLSDEQTKSTLHD